MGGRTCSLPSSASLTTRPSRVQSRSVRPSSWRTVRIPDPAAAQERVSRCAERGGVPYCRRGTRRDGAPGRRLPLDRSLAALLPCHDANHLQRAIHLYLPPTTDVSNAGGYVPLILERVRRGVLRWVASGEVTEVPPGVPLTVPDGEPPRRPAPKQRVCPPRRRLLPAPRMWRAPDSAQGGLSMGRSGPGWTECSSTTSTTSVSMQTSAGSSSQGGRGSRLHCWPRRRVRRGAVRAGDAGW